LNLSFTTGDQFSLERPPVYIIQKIGLVDGRVPTIFSALHNSWIGLEPHQPV